MSKTANGTTENYTYDADGNLLSDGEQTYTWDGENKLRSSTNSLTSITFHYDYLSRRIAKTTTSIPSDPWIPVLKPYNTVYAYDGWNLILEKKIVDEPYDGIKYTWGIDLSGSLQGAGGVGGLLSVTENNQTYYPTYDGNGNVSEYLDRTSNIVAHYEFDAFGNTIDSKTTGAKANDFAHRFSTKPLDSETGFYYYGYRYYNPTTGTWPSRDPIEEVGGLNIYAFIGNDGINNWDYLGLRDPSPCEQATYQDNQPGGACFCHRYPQHRLCRDDSASLPPLPEFVYPCWNETNDKPGQIKCEKCCDNFLAIHLTHLGVSATKNALRCSKLRDARHLRQAKGLNA